MGAAQAAVRCNERFGDNLDPRHAVACVQAFIKNCPSLKCKDCGWLDKHSGKCRYHGHQANDAGTCPMFLHVFNVTDDVKLNGGIIL